MLLKLRLMHMHLFLSSSTRQWRRRKLTMTFGAYFALQTTPATADSILLINGDKISGTLIKKETEHLVIKTSYAGELQVQWAEIKNIEADKSMQLVFKDGTKFWGRFMPDGHGNVKIIGDHNHLALHRTLSDVQYVNPSKEVLGEEMIWTGNFNAGATFNQGNSDNRNAQINGQSILRNKQHRYTLQGYAYWAQQGGQDIQNNTRIKGQYDRFFDKKWYGYLNTTFENDRFRDIRLSTNLGAGTGYQIYESKKRNLSLEGGLTWVDLRYYSAPEASYPAARWAVNYDQYLFDSFVQLFHREELLYMPSTPSQIILHSQSGLRFPFILGFNATTQVDYNYNSRPVNNRYKADTRALFTLGYTWK